jgi:hypothetical protein
MAILLNEDVNAGADLCAVYSKRVKGWLSIFVKFERQTCCRPSEHRSLFDARLCLAGARDARTGAAVGIQWTDRACRKCPVSRRKTDAEHTGNEFGI